MLVYIFKCKYWVCILKILQIIDLVYPVLFVNFCCFQGFWCFIQKETLQSVAYLKNLLVSG